MRRRWLRSGAVVCLIALVFVGVRVFVAPTFFANPDSVHIVVTEEVPLPTLRKTVVFDHQFSQQATAAYAQLVSGGPLSNGAACPAIGGNQPYYHYDLTFFHGGITTTAATSDAYGCMYFTVQYPLGASQGYSWLGSGHTSFWIRLNQLVNAPEPIGVCATMPDCHS